MSPLIKACRLQSMNYLQDLEKRLIRTGHLSYWGAFCQQNPAAFLSLNRLLNGYSFDTIIELGTHDGGVSTQLALYCHLSRTPAKADSPTEPCLYKNSTHHRRPKTFYTFDYVVRDQSAIDTITLLGGRFEQRDTLFNAENIEYIRGLIRNGGAVLLLCDGDNKKMEVDLYGGALKPGDFIMAHDWAYDAAAFERNKGEGVWFSHETKWESTEGEGQQFGLKDACERYGIAQVYADEFNRVAWFCGTKV